MNKKLYMKGRFLKDIKWHKLYNTDKYDKKMVLINSFDFYELEDLAKEVNTSLYDFIKRIDDFIKIKGE